MRVYAQNGNKRLKKAENNNIIVIGDLNAQWEMITQEQKIGYEERREI